MSTIDIKALMAYGAVAPLARYINYMISQQQDIDALDGITFNTVSGTSKFVIKTQTYTSSGVVDDSLAIGYNIAGDSIAGPPLTKLVAGQPAFRMGIESDYKEGGTGNLLVEWNTDYSSPNNDFSSRPFYWSANRTTNATYMYHMADVFDLFSPVWHNKSIDALTTYITCVNGFLNTTTLQVGFGGNALSGYGAISAMIFGSSLYHQDTNPGHYFDAYGATADSRVWTFKATSSDKSFRMSLYNDLGTIATDFFRVIRNGTTVSTIGIPNGITTYADNAAALAGGLVAGDLYRITGADTLAIVH